MAEKSVVVAYLLWLFGGYFGLHLFYLERDRQAFLQWMTFGGYFGVGWLYDAFMIRKYVAEANEDERYMEALARKMREMPKPVLSRFRYFLHLCVADFFGNVVVYALPVELIGEKHMPFAKVLVPFGVAIGVHLTGNIGRIQGKFIYPLLGAYATYPFYLLGWESILVTSIVSLSIFEKYGKEWRRTPTKKRSLIHRLSVLIVCGLLYLSLWGSFLYFNCEVQSEDGETVKCRDAAKHFFTSPMWKEFQAVVKEVWEYAQHNGWREVWRHIMEAFDPQGKTHALKVLGLNDTASQQEIATRYRKLSRVWHPDKHKDPYSKAEAEVKFIEIQQAYEILSNMKAHRTARNIKDA